MKPILLLAVTLALQTAGQGADTLRFAKIINDNMVLQQQKPITLWGWVKPGAAVNVTLTQDATLGQAAANKLGKQPHANEDSGEYSVTGRYVEKNPPKLETQTLKIKAGNDGRWLVKFPPAKASFQPTWIIAESGEQLAVAKNALIGEIWICAGQATWVGATSTARIAKPPRRIFRVCATSRGKIPGTSRLPMFEKI